MTTPFRQEFFDSIIETLITLEGYDKSNIILKSKSEETNSLTIENATTLILMTKEQLQNRGENVTYFGLQNNNKNLNGII
jgi:hypothetical protein